MSFEIDRETFNDLEIFTESGGRKNIFSIFNCTRTEGGKQALKELMLKPTSDLMQLALTRDAIQFLHYHGLELQMSYNQLDMIEHYLRFNKKLLRSNFLDALWDHWSNKVNMTSDYYIVSEGVAGLVKLLRSASEFVQQLHSKGAPASLLELFEPLRELIGNRTLKEVVQIKNKDLTCFQLNRLDHFIRTRERQTFREVLQIIYRIDVYVSVGLKLRQRGWCLPEFVTNDREKFEIKALRHPAIENGVENDYGLDADTTVTLLTGPNMGGKSSWLKAVGIAVYLAHLGFPVPATRFRTPVYKGLVTMINLPDNIYDGLSHYYSEVKRVKKTALKLLEQGPMFVLFDELFRGTNFKDAYEASLTVISSLSKIQGSKFLVSTHIVELANELKSVPKVSFSYFDCRFEDGKAVFTYKLKEGISEERLGMYIIRDEGS